MKQTNHTDQSGQAQDVQVQPLTEQEIQQVSGGHGPNRFLMVSVPQRSTGAPGSQSFASGKSFGLR